MIIEGKKNKIDKTARLIGDVNLGDNNYIGQNAVIIGTVHIGNNNKIFPNSVIGTPAQHIDIIQDIDSDINNKKVIQIGNNNIVREFTTIHKPTDSITKIHNSCFFMAYSHIPHDCEIFNNVIITNNCQIAGFSKILENANIGLSTVIHQYTTIGAYAMVGMGSVVTKDILPFLKVAGNPARYMNANIIGMKRGGFSGQEIEEIKTWIQSCKNLKFPDESYEFNSERLNNNFKNFFKLKNRNRKNISLS